MWKDYKGSVLAGTARARKLWAVYKDQIKETTTKSSTIDKEPLIWQLYSRQMDVVPQDDDFTTFINARPTRLANKITPLQWWSATSQRTTYPALSKLAIDVFTPFSQSAVSEGTFSSARRTIP